MNKSIPILILTQNDFKSQLSNLYQADIVDTDAEMKVFETMLKADGYDTSNDFNKKED